MRFRVIIPIVLLLFALSTPVLSDELNVPDDYDTIQEAIDEADDGDTILVETDFYYENLDLLGKSITIESADGPEDTVIDGTDLTLGDEYGSVFHVVGVDGDGATIRGFTITAGSGTDIQVDDSQYRRTGGASSCGTRS